MSLPSTPFALFAAPHTPMRENGDINLAAIPEQAALLRQEGVRGAFICGTTGEGPSLSAGERTAIAIAWRLALGDDQTLIVNVGHNSLAEASALATHAAEIGADAIALHPPSYFKPTRVEDLIDCCARVAHVVPALPVYYYHIPALTGVRLPMNRFLQQGQNYIPNLRGIKFSDANLAEYRACLTLSDGAFDILFGVDEMLLGALVMGGAGAVGSTYNYAAPLYHDMIAAFRRGDMAQARTQAARAIGLSQAILAADVVASGKACMALRGIHCGPVRPPLRNLTREDQAALERRLRALSII